jgi:hypothetical protein
MSAAVLSVCVCVCVWGGGSVSSFVGGKGGAFGITNKFLQKLSEEVPRNVQNFRSCTSATVPTLPTVDSVHCPERIWRIFTGV